MTKLDLETHLRINKRAAKHADSIRQTMSSLQGLRQKGLVTRGYTLVSPFGSKAEGQLKQGKARTPARLRVGLTEFD